MNRLPTNIDTVMAKGTELLSGYCHRNPDGRIARRVMGDHPTEWSIANTDAADVPWIEFKAGIGKGILPADHTHRVLASVPRRLIDDRLRRAEGGPPVLAAAYRLGAVTMMASVTESQRVLLPHTQEPSHWRVGVALGLGGGALSVAIGTRVEQDFTPFDISDLRADVYAADALAQQYPNLQTT